MTTNTHELIEALEMVISRLDKAKYQRELDEYDCVTMTYDRDEIDKIRQALAIQPQAEAPPGVGELATDEGDVCKLIEGFADNIEELAFRIPAPNEYTPQFVTYANAMRLIARKRRELTPAQPAGDVREIESDHPVLLQWYEGKPRPEYMARSLVSYLNKNGLAIVTALSATPAVSGWRFLDAIYDAEINVQFGTFWDGGIDWTLGDHMNGVKAEGTCRTWPDVERELRAAIAVHYPAVTLPPQTEGGDGDG